jgi:hypothetical protein
MFSISRFDLVLREIGVGVCLPSAFKIVPFIGKKAFKISINTESAEMCKLCYLQT